MQKQYIFNCVSQNASKAIQTHLKRKEKTTTKKGSGVVWWGFFWPLKVFEHVKVERKS